MAIGPERWMIDGARKWCVAEGLDLVAEYRTPWGVCDLVGVEIDSQRLNERANARQRTELGPLRRVAIFQALAASSPHSLTALMLAQNTGHPVEVIEKELRVLKLRRFISEPRPGEFVALAAWYPLHRRVLAIELKHTRVREVIAQASANFSFATESYVGLPIETARALVTTSSFAKLNELGLGLLGVSRFGAETLAVSRRVKNHESDLVLQAHCAELCAKRRLVIYKQTSMSA